MPPLPLARLHRRAVLAGAFGLPVLGAARARADAADAEKFVADNIQRGLDILNDKTLSADARRTRFAAFLLALTDIRRVALFLLGSYAAGAPPGQVDAFVDAFRAYSLAIYQAYFAQYAGQTLRVTGSRQRAPGDDIVRTTLTAPGEAPMQVDFRIRSDTGKPVLVDIAVADVWLALAQRAEFAAVLSRSHGDISALIQHLHATAAQYH